MKKRSVFGLMTMTAALAVLLAACGGKSASKSGSTSAVKFSSTIKNDKKAIKGGTLKVALVDDAAFAGLFSQVFYSDAFDAAVMAPANEGLFGNDADFTYNKDGAATIKLDVDAKTATIKLRDNVKWSDGQPVVAKDVEFAYEMVANKDTKSTRYTDSLANIVGMDAYHKGQASTISGIEMPDGDNGKTVVIHYNQMRPGMTKSGNGYIWESAEPYHYLKNVPMNSMDSSDQIRKKPLFFGPFVMTKIVPGQSVEYKPNKYYYKGMPKLDKITTERVGTDTIVSSMKNKKYDVAMQMPTDIFEKYKDVKGYTLLGKLDLAYSYIGFKVGHWDTAAGKNVMDKNSKMANKSLRQAMAYALNMDEINQKFYAGVRTRGTTLIPTVFPDYHDSSIKGYPLDIKKANKLLDDAGYKKGKDGYRTDPQGKKLVINFASMAGGSSAEAIAQDYLQQWKKIGLNVKLTNGRLLEFNSFYKKIQAPTADDVDVFAAAWGLSSEASPNDLYNERALWNYTHFVTDKNNELLKKIDSVEAFDNDYRTKAFKDWQKHMYDEAFVVPTQYRDIVYPVSDRVKNFSIKVNDVLGNPTGWQNIELTSEK